MNGQLPKAHAAEEVRVGRFGFRTTNASIKGGIGGSLLIAGGLAWASLTGRLHDTGATYWGGWGLGALIVTMALWRAHRQSLRHAQALGQIELDAAGLRWLRPDQTVVAKFRWQDVVEAIVERRTSTVVVRLRSQDAGTVRNAFSLGDASGYVTFENFDTFLQAFRRYCEVKDSSSWNRQQSRLLSRKSLAASAVFAMVAAMLFGANRQLETAFKLRHAFPLALYCLAFLAAVYAFAGLALWRGNAPLVSVLHHPKFWTRRLPGAVALLVLINFLLVWLFNL